MKMRIEYVPAAFALPKGLDRLLGLLSQQALDAEGLHDRYQLSIMLTDDCEIQRINEQTRGIDRATDVLSFPSAEYSKGTAKEHSALLRQERDTETGRIHLGDLVISAPRAMEQAASYGHSFVRELGFLYVHGLLHLMGYDHIEESQAKQMRGMEEIIMEKTGLVRGLTQEEQTMVDLAFEAMSRAYVPYSAYRVGACVQDEKGRLHKGCNVENASYGMTICAERNALTTAVTEGMESLRCIAIVIEKGMPSPCGACRQFMREFASDAKVILASRDGARITTLSALLPDSFGPESLEE